ncbi:MAG: transporter [Kiritimatiellae bacterium]|nr:transporter [Kiritimatiellia bacterium]
MTGRIGLAVAAVLCVFAVAASAEWERTIFAWDTRLPAQGKFQTSLWGDYYASEVGDADATTMDAALYLAYGIADHWSACVAPGFVSWDVDGGDSESGISDTALMTTYRFMEEKDSGADVAILGRVNLPTGDDDKGLGSGNVEPGFLVLASKTLGPIVAVANAGATAILDADDGEEDFILRGAVECLYPLNEQLNLNALLAAQTARADGEDDDVELGFGTRYTPVEQFFVLGAGYVCLTDAYDWGATLAAGYEF